MKKYFNRELSWLSFNYRVLQEAINPEVPLLERLRFLAIYSSNLDEFYRVRVASYSHVLRMQEEQGLKRDQNIVKLLKTIKKRVMKQQEEFGEIFRNELIPQLKKQGIHLVNESQIDEKQIAFLKRHFKKEVLPHLKITDIFKTRRFLRNKGLYLTVETQRKEGRGFYLVNIPIKYTDRFIVLPSDKNKQVIIQLSDVVRLFLQTCFKKEEIVSMYAIKLTRDAELYLEEEIAETIQERILSSLHKRKIGDPVRFLYDETMPKELLRIFRKRLKIKKNDLVPGGRYHNFNDFFGLPVQAKPNLEYEKFEPLNHPRLKATDPILDKVSREDIILHFPYQTYEQVLQFVEQSSQDKNVEEIDITLYRVAKDSRICEALINAQKSGKKVTVFNEVKARFDEELNMKWGKRMKDAGIQVIYSFDEIKVHSKICMVKRREGDKLVKYAYFGTGNFNEATARIYCDHALLTKDPELCDELDKVFKFLKGEMKKPSFKNLLVAPFSMRDTFKELIDQEIQHVKNGKVGKMIIKMNSLQDKDMINKLYEASNAGVKITIIVRGICCLIPGVDGMSKNIKVVSIIDRYLEHGRIYWFNNDGDEKLYLASADWMSRNLSRRIEVGFPIKHKAHISQIMKLIKLQLRDNVKARRLNKTQSNPYKKSTAKKKVRAQYDYYHYLKGLIKS